MQASFELGTDGEQCTNNTITSQHHNITASQHHYITTSQHHNIATSLHHTYIHTNIHTSIQIQTTIHTSIHTCIQPFSRRAVILGLAIGQLQWRSPSLTAEPDTSGASRPRLWQETPVSADGALVDTKMVDAKTAGPVDATTGHEPHKRVHWRSPSVTAEPGTSGASQPRLQQETPVSADGALEDTKSGRREDG